MSYSLSSIKVNIYGIDIGKHFRVLRGVIEV